MTEHTQSQPNHCTLSVGIWITSRASTFPNHLTARSFHRTSSAASVRSISAGKNAHGGELFAGYIRSITVWREYDCYLRAGTIFHPHNEILGNVIIMATRVRGQEKPGDPEALPSISDSLLTTYKMSLSSLWCGGFLHHRPLAFCGDYNHGQVQPLILACCRRCNWTSSAGITRFG